MLKRIITLDEETVRNILDFASRSADPAMGMVAVIVIASLFSEERCWTLRPAGPHYFERIYAIRAADKALENESDDYAAGATINLPNGQIIGTVGVCSRARHQDYDHEFARLIKKYAEELIAAF